jgi:glycosidase
MRVQSLRFLFLCIVCFAVCGLQKVGAQAGGGAPAIEKIDPPGWWVALPEPMLLVHGEHLKNAKFAVSGRGVGIVRTQASENGHWAFVWLRTANAAAQTLKITARNASGEAKSSYKLAERMDGADAHKGFSAADAMYLIMTDRFADGNTANDESAVNGTGLNRAAPRGWHGGDFAGIEQHLDYLQQLGVTTVWTTPVASNGKMPESYHGYAAVDLYATDAHFGTVAEYRHLSDALHARQMKLVIDLVPNHLGVEHVWVNDPPAPEWFHGTLASHTHVGDEFRNLLDPHAAPRAYRDITRGWFTDGMPDLNQENPLVEQYLIQNAMWWVETANLDGIRLDTFPYVGRAFWHDFHAALHAVYPHLTTVGEVFNADAEVTSFFAGGVARSGADAKTKIDTGLDTPFDYPFYFALRGALTENKPMTALAHVLNQDALYPHPERLVPFFGNHDTARFLTAAGGSVPKLKLALGIVTTVRGMPQIYSGDEIAMTGGDDPDNRHDFPGGFPGDKHNAFVAQGRTAVEQEVFAWTSSLLSLRAEHAALRGGVEQNLLANDDVLAFVRAEDENGCKAGGTADRLLIVVNKARESRSVEIPLVGTALEGCTAFETLRATAPAKAKHEAGTLRVDIPAESMTIDSVR